MSNYHDIDGNPCTLGKLCATDPRWAASRIAALTAERDSALQWVINREGDNPMKAERDALRAALKLVAIRIDLMDGEVWPLGLSREAVLGDVYFALYGEDRRARVPE